MQLTTMTSPLVTGDFVGSGETKPDIEDSSLHASFDDLGTGNHHALATSFPFWVLFSYRSSRILPSTFLQFPSSLALASFPRFLLRSLLFLLFLQHPK